MKPLAQSTSEVSEYEDECVIVSASVELPGIKTLEALWQYLCDKQSISATSNATCKALSLSNAGLLKDWGFLEEYGVSSSELAHIDPQQYLTIHVIHKAIQRLNLPIETLQGLHTDVYTGVMSVDHLHQQIEDSNPVDSRFFLNHCEAIVANRASHYFNFSGESKSINAACASSLVALKDAYLSIQAGDSDFIFVTGVNYIGSKHRYHSFNQAGMLSRTGKCHSFAINADGYIPLEGACCVLITRRSLAEELNIRPLAIIKKIQCNHNGSTPSMTAPSVKAQSSLISMVKQGIEDLDINYVEAHGTGTNLGDPIELEAIHQQYPGSYVGSIKANLGHHEAGAGILGLIKTILILKNNLIPPHSFHGQQNILIPNNLNINEQATEYRNKHIAVSSFGFGGSNAHAILERFEVKEDTNATDVALPLLLAADDKVNVSLLGKCIQNYYQDKTLIELQHFTLSQMQHQKMPLYRKLAWLSPQGEIGEWQSGPLKTTYQLEISFTDKSKCDDLKEFLLAYFPRPLAIDAHGLACDFALSLADPKLTLITVNGKSVTSFKGLDKYIDELCALPTISDHQFAQLIEQSRQLYQFQYTFKSFIHAHFESNIVDILKRDNIPPYCPKLIIMLIWFRVKLTQKWSLSASESEFVKVFPWQFQNWISLLKQNIISLQEVVQAIEHNPQSKHAICHHIEQQITSINYNDLPKLLAMLVIDTDYVAEEGDSSCVIHLSPTCQITIESSGSKIQKPIDYTGLMQHCWLQGINVDWKQYYHSIPFYRQGLVVVNHLPAKLYAICHQYVTQTLKYDVFQMRLSGIAELEHYLQLFRTMHELINGLNSEKSVSIITEDDAFFQHASLIANAINQEYASSPLKCLDTYGRQYDYDYIELKPTENSEQRAFQQYGHYVILGGSGGLGISLCNYLLQNYQAKISLVGRKNLIDLPDSVKTLINHEDVHYISCDVLNHDQLFDILESISETSTIDALFHLAIETKDKLLSQLTTEQLTTLLTERWRANAWLGSDRLNQFVKAVHVFTSIQAYCPNVGGSLYCYESLVKSTLLKQCQVPNKTLTYLGVIDGVGLAAQSDYGQYLDRYGMAAVQVDEFLSLLDSQIANRVPAAIICSFKSKDKPVVPLYNNLESALSDYVVLSLFCIFHGKPSVYQGHFQFLYDELASLWQQHNLSEKHLPAYQKKASILKEQLQNSDYQSRLTLFEAVLCKYEDILEGKIPAHQLVFPAGQTKLVEGFYSGHVCADFANQSLVSELRHILDHRPNLRILEIGAGSGATTKQVLSRLTNADYVDYTFTDVSQALVNKAKQTLSSPYASMTFSRLDVESLNQAHEYVNQFDVIIATNVIHATPSIVDTLQKLKLCLRSEGRVLLNELIEKSTFTTAIFGLFEGWWKTTDHYLRLENSPLLSSASWHNAIERAGLVNLYSTGSSLHGSLVQQQVIVCGESDNCSSVQEHSQAIEKNTFNINQLKEVVASTLHIDKTDISEDKKLADLGFDSLSLSDLYQKLVKQFKTLNIADLFADHSLASLATHLGINTTIEIENSSVIDQVHSCDDDIAIVGLSYQLPFGEYESFKDMLDLGGTAFTDIPNTRWVHDEFFDVERPGFSYASKASLIDDIDCFDASFFNISPREARLIDPQERLLLQNAYHALEEARCFPITDKNHIGVYVALSGNYYNWLYDWQEKTHANSACSYWSAANRISYALNLHGPSMTIDTACSSSLTALHLACQSLKNGDADIALAAAANLIVHPRQMVELSDLKMLSPTNQNNSFSSHGDGFVYAEGVVVLCLKKLSKAKEDGDQIHALIKASAVNSGGKTHGYTVPNATAQAELIQTALTRANLKSEQIAYVETHGTATKLGDPIETKALSDVLNHPLAIASVKSNMGHSEACAGFAGLVKIILQYQNESLYPSAHALPANPYCDFDTNQLRVVVNKQPWPAEPGNRYSGLSSFGAGGANAHVILQDYINPPINNPRQPLLFCLSAKDEATLGRKKKELLAYLTHHLDVDLASLSWTLLFCREHFKHRWVCIADNPSSLMSRLENSQINFEGESQALAGYAQVYLQGGIPGCQYLYDGFVIRAISASYYPFAKQPFWHDNQLAQMISLKRSDYYFDQHKLFEQPILPGVAHVYLMAKEVFATLKTQRLQFDNIQWLSPIICRAQDDRVDINCSVKSKAGHIEVSLFAKLAYSSLQASLLEDNQDNQAIDQKIKECNSVYPVNKLYQTFQDKGWQHGPVFQGVTELKTNSDYNNCFATICLNDHNNDDNLTLEPRMFDSVLQCVSVLQTDLPSNQVYIPQSIKQLKLFKPWEKTFTVFCETVEDTPNRVSYNITILDSNHSIITTIESFSMVPIHIKQIIPVAGLSYFSPYWQVVNSDNTATLTKAAVPFEALNINDYQSLKKSILHFKERIDNYRQQKYICIVKVNALNKPFTFAWQSFLNTLTTEYAWFDYLFYGVDEGFLKPLHDLTYSNNLSGLVVVNNQAQLFARQFQSVILNKTNLGFKPHGTYVISGGLGGISKILAKYLTDHYKANVLLLGRRNADQEKRWLEAHNLIDYQQVDITDKQQLAAAIESYRLAHGPINGVIHAAGWQQDRLLRHLDMNDMDAVMMPKISGVINLDQCLKHEPLEFFLLISSYASILANPGQSHYAAANAFLDSFAQCRELDRLAGKCFGKTIALNSPLWSEAGMSVTETVKSQMAKNWGMEIISQADGLKMIEQSLANEASQLIGFKGNNDLFLRALNQPNKVIPVRNDMNETKFAPTMSKQSIVENIIAEVIELRPPLDRQKSFGDLGYNSITFTELATKLSDIIEEELTAASFYDYNSVGEFLDAVTIAPAPQKNVDVPVSNQVTEVAIVGYHAIFPGCTTLDDFWQLLCDKKQVISKTPSFRQAWMKEQDAAFIDNVDQFDAAFFNMSSVESQVVDPQQRLLLQVVWHALEHGGIQPGQLKGSKTGVFVGASTFDYFSQVVKHKIENPYIPLGSVHCLLANRISYFLDLQGPSETIDTACSSSLYALHKAAESLRKGECETAIVCGVNLLLDDTFFDSFSASGMLSKKKSCTPFDEQADGYVRGEGIVVIVLQANSKALEQNNTIHAQLVNSAVNHGGKANTLTSPSSKAHRHLYELAYQNQDASQVSYLETHGTGTSIGDPIEVNGILSFFKQANQTIQLGSLKANIGHLEPASGLASVVKVLLMMKHQHIPPQAGLSKLNPQIKLENSPLVISSEMQPWRCSETPLTAGVNSFGFGGVNVHVIVQQPKSNAEPEKSGSCHRLLPLSANCESSLKNHIQALQQWIQQTDNIDIDRLCAHLQYRREHLRHRVVFRWESKAQLLSDINAYLANHTNPLNARDDLFKQLEDFYQGASWPMQYPQSLPKPYEGIPLYPFSTRRYWFAQPKIDTFYHQQLETCHQVKRTQPIEGENILVVYSKSAALQRLDQVLRSDNRVQLFSLGDVDLKQLGNQPVDRLVIALNEQDCESIEAIFMLAHTIANQYQTTKLVIQILIQCNNTTAISPMASAVVGLFESLSKEQPLWQSQVYCYDKVQLLPMLGQYHFDNKTFYIHEDQYHHISLANYEYHAHESFLKSPTAIMVIGGLGGIGSVVSEHLLKAYSVKLIILGRKHPDEIEHSLLTNYADAIDYMPVDITSSNEVMLACKYIKHRYQAIDAVFNLAMQLDDSTVANMSPSSFKQVLSVKQGSVSAVKYFCEELSCRKVVLFSSVQSYACLAGQANYAAASKYFDAYAKRYFAAPQYDLRLLNWSIWQDVGAVSDPYHLQQARALGYEPINSESGLKWMEMALDGAENQVIIQSLCEVVDVPNKPRSSTKMGYESANQFVANCIHRLAQNKSVIHHDLLTYLANQLPQTNASLDMGIERLYQQCIESDPDYKALYDLCYHCYEQYPDLLSGKIGANEILFSNKGSNLLKQLYSDIPESKACNDAIKNQVKRTLDKTNTSMRILEIGAGLGATTRCLVDILKQHQTVSYCYSDVSPYFLAQGEALAQQVSFPLTTQHVDINQLESLP